MRGQGGCPRRCPPSIVIVRHPSLNLGLLCRRDPEQFLLGLVREQVFQRLCFLSLLQLGEGFGLGARWCKVEEGV